MSSSSSRKTPATPRSPRRGSRTTRALEAIDHLKSADPRLADLIDTIGPFRPMITRDPFEALLGSIIQQQVSMSAAATIQGRVYALCDTPRPTPVAIAALTPEALRDAGLSRQKARYVRATAEAFVSGELSAPLLRRLDDRQVLERVTRIPGIGRWTAEMLLIFCLERPDIWPVDDLGLRKAVGRFLGLDTTPVARDIESVADAWRPYRTYATWYLWRSLEGPLMPGISLPTSADARSPQRKRRRSDT